MRELLEKLGNPLQAQSVPTHVERIARNQFGIVHSILKRRLMWERDSLALTYLTKDRVDSNGLPLYCVVAEGGGFGSMIPLVDVETFFVRPILNRFKGRAQIGALFTQEEANFYQWGMWLEEDMVRRFANQELPLFEEAMFDQFADFHFTTRLPMYAHDYTLLREKVEASAAALALQVQSESSMVVSMPAILSTQTVPPMPDADRLDYILRLLQPWKGKLEGFVAITSKELLEKKDFLARARMLREGTYQAEKADTLFVQLRIMGGKPKHKMSMPFNQSEAFAYFGAPHRTLLKEDGEVHVYYHHVGDALFLSEVHKDKIDVYLFAGEKRSAILFERFCQEITG